MSPASMDASSPSSAPPPAAPAGQAAEAARLATYMAEQCRLTAVNLALEAAAAGALAPDISSLLEEMERLVSETREAAALLTGALRGPHPRDSRAA